MIDNAELNAVMEKLENLEDEQLAVQLLKEFNDKSKAWGQLHMDMDPGLQNDEWKGLCDRARKDLDDVIERIMEA